MSDVTESKEACEHKSWLRRLIDWWNPPRNFYVVEATSYAEAINKSGVPNTGEFWNDGQVECIDCKPTSVRGLYVVTWRFAAEPIVKRYAMDNLMRITEVWE